MLKTRTPLTEVIAPGGTVQSMILLVLRVIEKQVTNRTRKPTRSENHWLNIDILLIQEYHLWTSLKFYFDAKTTRWIWLGIFLFFFFPCCFSFSISLSYVRPGTRFDLTGRIENEDPENEDQRPTRKRRPSQTKTHSQNVQLRMLWCAVVMNGRCLSNKDP